MKEEIEIMKHALGKNPDEPNRNFFCTGVGSKDYKHCESLVKKKFMFKRLDPFNQMEEGFVYHVTLEGFEYLKEIE